MKVLYVGCRVRIIYSPSFPMLAGKTGTIIAREEKYVEIYGSGPWIVSVDEWGGCKCPHADVRFAPFSEQLEPILPSFLPELEQEKSLV